MSREQQQRLSLEALERQLEAARKTEVESLRRYRRGLLPYVDALGAVTARETLEIARAQARAGLLLTRVQLYRALGGDWSFILEKEAQ